MRQCLSLLEEAETVKIVKQKKKKITSNNSEITPLSTMQSKKKLKNKTSI